MREIEFRAWDKIRHQIIEVDAIEFKVKEVFTDDGFGRPFNDIELIQYTGLHDKNGKKIYDGDIVNLTKIKGFCQDENWKFTGKVFWANGCYMAIHYNGQHVEKLWGDYTQMEVIGNSYENPELLEEKK